MEDLGEISWESMEGIQPHRGGTYVDGTAGLVGSEGLGLDGSRVVDLGEGLSEVREDVQPRRGGTYVDGTAGLDGTMGLVYASLAGPEGFSYASSLVGLKDLVYVSALNLSLGLGGSCSC